MKQWSDGSEAMEGGATAPLHRGVKGDRVLPLANHGRWATLHRSQVNPSNSPSLFVLVRRSEAGSDSREAVERGATEVKQWRVEGGATAPLHRGVKGDRVVPFVNHGRRCAGVR